MPSTSKSNRRKNKWAPKPKQQWRVKQPTRNWLELPSDLMGNILQRIGVVDMLENVQKVCTAWRKICKDPAMWRVISVDSISGPSGTISREMCRQAVDRSQGQLLAITMVGFCDQQLLHYVADRSGQLKRLEIIFSCGGMYEIWGEALKKLPLLEELSLGTKISQEDIEAAGRYCPMLKTLKVNHEAINFWDDDMITENEIALAIGKNLPELTHLELIGNNMNNIGLQAILDGCCHLESLDLRECLFLDLDLEGELGKRCSQQIKHLKLPHESLEGCPYVYNYQACDVLDGSEDDEDYMAYDYDSENDDEYLDYDDYTAYDNDDDWDNLVEMMAFMDMFG